MRGTRPIYSVTAAEHRELYPPSRRMTESNTKANSGIADERASRSCALLRERREQWWAHPHSSAEMITKSASRMAMAPSRGWNSRYCWFERPIVINGEELGRARSFFPITTRDEHSEGLHDLAAEWVPRLGTDPIRMGFGFSRRVQARANSNWR